LSQAEIERNILNDVLLHRLRTGIFPEVETILATHKSHEDTIERLVTQGELDVFDEYYGLTLKGLVRCGSEEALKQLHECEMVISGLQEAFRSDASHGGWNEQELAARSGVPWDVFDRATDFLWMEIPVESTPSGVSLNPFILSVPPLAWWGLSQEAVPAMEQIAITGYRAFASFKAALGTLTVIIGANASGKSSLFEFLRLLSQSSANPLPPEIEPGLVGKRLFHAGGPERFAFDLVANFGEERRLRYEAEVHGPVGAPRVQRERLSIRALAAQSQSQQVNLLDFQNGRGKVLRIPGDFAEASWTVASNEFALRRALDPTLLIASHFQRYVSSWRFYSGFDVSVSAALRRPVPSEPSPVLSDTGANLSAVLFALMTEHLEIWRELETHLRSAVPGFQSMSVKPRGGPGTVIGIWREEGVKEELTLADLSDGTLRLLCWAALCLSPNLPPLVCIDEPELGLHPRVLPVLAGLLRAASARTQLIVTTHSPYFLSQFSLDEIAVMRKEQGRAVFVRPGSSAALRREVEELGGEALAQLHISDELEVRS